MLVDYFLSFFLSKKKERRGEVTRRRKHSAAAWWDVNQFSKCVKIHSPGFHASQVNAPSLTYLENTKGQSEKYEAKKGIKEEREKNKDKKKEKKRKVHCVFSVTFLGKWRNQHLDCF